MPARSLLPLPRGRAGKVRAYVRLSMYTLQGRANAGRGAAAAAGPALVACGLSHRDPGPRPHTPPLTGNISEPATALHTFPWRLSRCRCISLAKHHWGTHGKCEPLTAAGRGRSVPVSGKAWQCGPKQKLVPSTRHKWLASCGSYGLA